MKERPIKVVLVGSPNVGKSAIFNYLTGSYVAVSNYPGTTVDISTGFFGNGNRRFEIIDTPGIYSLIPLTEEEKVTRMFLTSAVPDVVVHVVDTKNIRRMLIVTLQLLEAGLPVILTLNIMDEARDMGMLIDIELLEKLLAIPVVATSIFHKSSLASLKRSICNYRPGRPIVLQYDEKLEQAIDLIAGNFSLDYGLSKRMAVLLLLQGDPITVFAAQQEKNWPAIADSLKQLSDKTQRNLEAAVALNRQVIVDRILSKVIRYANCKPHSKQKLAEWLGKLTRQAITGIPILCLVLYFGLYQFVGRFGAGYLVDYLNNSVFVPVINPVVEQLVNTSVPWEWAKSLLVGEYGVFTMGFRYAMAIVLPIVGTFFLAFAVLEDSGYLPRLAMLVDNVFRYFGLNGRAVIPITLGLGCGTMAVMVTRTLESKRERLLATFLLALTIPCSAQLGVVLALLSQHPIAVIVWSIYMLIIFVSVGWLSAKLVPGSRSSFYMEIPPLRVPLISNVIKKAYTRMSWYFMEILPVFIVTSLVLWAGQLSGALTTMISWLEPAMLLIGLPPEMAQVFLLGFFRRDYGAAGLYDLVAAGKLTEIQLIVAAVAITLFVPCVAQFAVMIKERGIYITTAMIGLIIGIAFASAGLVHQILMLFL
ncbi:ferrous iron transport protein B [Sporomusa aerivorans]|uniref:ferrous iron transport protein B n=1 Tax=Sporomusa aerivorans TaxID=204936 RepID=UPI00352AD42A